MCALLSICGLHFLQCGRTSLPGSCRRSCKEKRIREDGGAEMGPAAAPGWEKAAQPLLLPHLRSREAPQRKLSCRLTPPAWKIFERKVDEKCREEQLPSSIQLSHTLHSHRGVLNHRPLTPQYSIHCRARHCRTPVSLSVHSRYRRATTPFLHRYVAFVHSTEHPNA